MAKNGKPEDSKQKDKKSSVKKPKDDKSKDSKDSTNEKIPEMLGDKQRENLELELQQAQRWKKSIAVHVVIVFLSLFGAWIFVIELFGFDFKSSPIIGILLYAIIAVIIGCMIFIYVHSFFDYNENMIRDQIRNNDEINRLQNETKEDIFENSIKMSYKYLDQYYLQTREQARQGFKVCVFVSVCGFILICIGIVFMFLDRAAPSYITCGTGAITEFIAAVFFYLYNKTVSSMSNYHNKLVLSHNVSIALKVAESLPQDEKVNAKKTIINELLKDFNIHLVKEDEKGEAST